MLVSSWILFGGVRWSLPDACSSLAGEFVIKIWSWSLAVAGSLYGLSLALSLVDSLNGCRGLAGSLLLDAPGGVAGEFVDSVWRCPLVSP